MSAPRVGGVSDRKMLLWLAAGMVMLIVAVSVLAPRRTDDDPRPTTYNSGPQGARAVYLALTALGWKVSRWERPLAEWNAQMNDAEAARTTLVLADPVYDPLEREQIAAEVRRFLERGGRVLTSGALGARLLGGDVSAPSLLQRGLCETTPEGPGTMARAGSVEITELWRWTDDSPQVQVEQRCGQDAVVVRFAVGKGEAVWWSSATPMENAEIKNDGDLRLMLASLDDDGRGDDGQEHGRAVVFDEGVHGEAMSLWGFAHQLGLPLRWMELQAVALFLLLLASFSRRRGPVRLPVAVPRSSPVEFAENMGDLYEKAGATAAATEAARRRLLRMLTLEVGLSSATIAEGPEAIAAALRERLNAAHAGVAGSVREHLLAAIEAASTELSPRSALALVRALSEDAERVRAAM
jgi:hypothetical protein